MWNLFPKKMDIEQNHCASVGPILGVDRASKGMEPAAGAFTDTRDSRPLQDGIKDLSVLHPVTVTNC